MYVLKNAKRNLIIFKGRNLIACILFAVISILCCISLSVLQASKEAEISTTATIPVSAYLADYGREDPYVYETPMNHLILGTRLLLTYKILEPKNKLTFDILEDLGDSEYVTAQYNQINIIVSGMESENFKSYALYVHPDYSAILGSVTAQIVSTQMRVNICKGEHGNDITRFSDETLNLISGKMPSNDNEKYECIIDAFLSLKLMKNIGGKIGILLGNSIFDFEIVGIYSSPNIEKYINDIKNETRLDSLFALIEYGYTESYVPHLYVNTSGYTIAEEKAVVVSDNLDVIISGYGADYELTDFIDGKKVIIDGQMFNPESSAFECVIPEKVAFYNGVKVGDYISIMNPVNKEEFYDIKVVGIYYSKEEKRIRLFDTDIYDKMESTGINITPTSIAVPLNTIYMSYKAVEEITIASNHINDNPNSAIQSSLSTTLFFKDVHSLSRYKSGLPNYYTGKFHEINLQDLFDRLVLIRRTTNLAIISFIIEILIGGLFLILFHIFILKERKYEIGVLLAIGMNKRKIAFQFIIELVVIAFFAMFIGSIVGAMASKPISESLTNQNIGIQQVKYDAMTQNFGRTPDISVGSKQFVNDSEKLPENRMFVKVDFLVLLKLIGVSLILIIISISGTIMYIFTFEPTKILNEVA